MLLLAGTLFAAIPIAGYVFRSAPPMPAADRPHPPKRTSAPALIERASILPGAADLPSFLLAQGVDRQAAASAVCLAQAQLTGAGPITVVLGLRESGNGPTVVRIRATRSDSSGVVLTRDRAVANGWRVEPLARAVTNRLTVVRGEMNDESLYASAVAAGVDEALIPDFAKAFVYDFDFQREIAPGDVFEMAAEQPVNADGQPVGPPALVYAAFTTADKARALYRFVTADGEAGWYDGNGRSIVRAFMRTPVDGARVSSTFGWRIHPVEGYRKLHQGIDFAVPNGTPVYAAAAGTVETARFSDTAGNMVILRHDGGYETKYFHLTGFAAGVAPGGRVGQGQEIGLSGTTGRSTGPHLHYEMHLNGPAIDPMTVAANDTGRALAGDDLAAFRRERDRIDAARAGHRR